MINAIHSVIENAEHLMDPKFNHIEFVFNVVELDLSYALYETT